MKVIKCDFCGNIVEYDMYYGVQVDRVFNSKESMDMCESCAKAILKGVFKVKPPSDSWISRQKFNTNTGAVETEYTCGFCNEHVDQPTNYCPNCGACMLEV